MDPEIRRRYAREWVARRRAAWFADKVCLRCNSRDNLTLDHRDPATKVSHRIWSWSAARGAAELEKCQVLCRVCHRWKTRGCGEYAVGEAHGKARLTQTDVLLLRKRAAAGERIKTVAAELNLPYKTAWAAATGVTWKHLDEV